MADPAGAPGAATTQTRPENPVPHYLGALVTGALVIGLAFFIKDAPTKWIVVATGIFMFVAVLFAFAKEMAGQRKSS